MLLKLSTNMKCLFSWYLKGVSSSLNGDNDDEEEKGVDKKEEQEIGDDK